MSFSSTTTGLLHALLRRGARRRLVRLIPVVGVVFAAVHVRRTVRAKGPMHGSVDAALDLLPIVGPIKAVAELLVGDLIGPRKDPAAA